MATSRIVVGRVGEMEQGDRKLVSANGREIGVFRLSDGYHALHNYCPHRAGPLCHGRVRPLVVDKGVYALDYEREGEILKCPWHQWEFDIRTGCALYDEKLRVRTYRVVEEGDEVVLYV